MSEWPAYPAVYEINAWVWLRELSPTAGPRVTLDTMPESELQRLAGYGFDALWLMGVWQRSPASRRIGREQPGLQEEFGRALPGWTPADVVGSPYAVYDYDVDPLLGDAEGLASLRRRLARYGGLRLILDFVPNHLAVDHAWVHEHPERFVQGNAVALAREPENYFRTGTGKGSNVLAHGRDPNFAGWSDTAQLDVRRPDTRRAMREILSSVAARCDGVRCDMSMLVLRDVFLRTWGGRFEPRQTEFWTEAIDQIRTQFPGFLFLAEAYWDREWDLQQLGFDYTYDKRLYDRLLDGDAGAVRGHLGASPAYQRHLARFIENHDERRSAGAFGSAGSRAAATLALTLPGLRLLHQGQLDGRRIRLPVQLGRGQPEPTDPDTERFYRRLLAALRHPVFHDGDWRLLEPLEAWPGNQSREGFVAHRWRLGEEVRLVVVNLPAVRGQCYVPLGGLGLDEGTWRLVDLLGDAVYVRQGAGLANQGLYLDLPGHGYHLFAVERA